MSANLFKISFPCKAKVLLFVLFSLLSSFSLYSQSKVQRPVDVVICMDLSGSTNGLVEVYRDKMWDVINQWKMFTPTPAIRIGVIGFSRYSFTDNSGYVRIISGLSDDYDQLSNDLFAIKPYVENGIQFVGAALGTAINDMEWSEKPGAFKLIYIMGNGEVNLGNFDYRHKCELAKEKGIIVNTVYCIKTNNGLRDKELPGWKEIAHLTGGECFEVQLAKRNPIIKANMNGKLLIALNDSLNRTCIPYGKKGIDRLKLMLETDANTTLTYDNYIYSRLKYKLSAHYTAKQLSWDVVTYKQTYPDSKLAAIRSSVSTDQNTRGDLEKVVNTELERRLQLLEALKMTIPIGEEEKIHTEAAGNDFEINNMLDRVLIATFYKQAVAAGFVK